MPSLKEVKLESVAESKEFKYKKPDIMLEKEENKNAFSEPKKKKRIQLSKNKVKLNSNCNHLSSNMLSQGINNL